MLRKRWILAYVLPATIILALLISQKTAVSGISYVFDPKYCEKGSDCVPFANCHSVDVVNTYHTSRIGTACTAVCAGPLDCGCGKPVCLDSRCAIQKVANYSWCPK